MISKDYFDNWWYNIFSVNWITNIDDCSSSKDSITVTITPNIPSEITEYLTANDLYIYIYRFNIC